MQKEVRFLFTLALLMMPASLVRAQSAHSHSSPLLMADVDYVDEPQGCWMNHKKPCAIMPQKKPLGIQVGDSEMVLAPNTGFVVIDAQHVRFLQGSVWIKKSENLVVHGGLLDTTISGEAWIEMVSGRLMLKNLSGQIKTERAGLNYSQELPVGFENWYQGLRSDGQVSSGMMSPIVLTDFVVPFNHVAELPRRTLKTKIKTFAKAWKGTAEAASQLYSEVITRRVAQWQEEQDTKERLAEKRAKERQQQRQMLLQRAFDR